MTGFGAQALFARLQQPVLTIVLIVTGGALPAVAADHCHWATDSGEVRAAMGEIRRSVDPCGETDTVAQVLAEFERCGRHAYAVCINRASERNSIDRSNDASGAHMTITWNPDLRTELEVGCNADPAQPVLRDPVASLLHEIAHAVQDCRGLDPNEHELEAVRIENIYRRARGLCQRTAYGTEALPPDMVLACEPDFCLCTPRQQRPMTADAPGGPDHATNAADGASDTP